MFKPNVNLTKRWIRNAADKRAVANGCRFDEARGKHAIDFAAEELVLYEGEYAGQPLIARDWQIEATMRLFGWVKWSEEYQRWIRRFNECGLWIAKKNKKSPTLAWWALYIMAGDGEPGQNVYLGAKDAKQVKLTVGKHVMEMVRLTPRLSQECDINKTEMQILHRPSRSRLVPLSSGDSNTQKSKEGLNGSLVVDEAHIVDDEFWGRVSRCGISRSEPLNITVSTAGDDPTCFGKKRFDYGETVNRAGKGDPRDDSFLHIAYCAPQDLTDAELAKDPLKYFHMANPAAGHTVHAHEFLEDYTRSQASIINFNRFKKYRLNIWQSGEAKWLRDSDWTKCGQGYSAEDLAGRECYAGLDLATTRDTTALVLVFPPTDDDPLYYLLPYFWLPRETAVEQRETTPYLDWDRDGLLKLTPGGVCDYGFIRQQIVDIRQQFDLRAVLYDPYNATHLALQLRDEDGIWVEEFKQGVAQFAGPTGQFERLLISKGIAHNRHAVLTWQAGHVQVKCDANYNKRPVKPEHGDPRKIDGIVAAVMGLSAAMTPQSGSFYDDPNSQLESG